VRTRLAAAAVVAAAVVASACARGDHGSARERIVAEVVDRKVTLEDLDAYLADNLVSATPEDPSVPEDFDRVKSRLLDALLDETLLAAEAERRGIRVTEEEIDAYAAAAPDADGSDGPPPRPRAALRREVLAQKLREADASERSKVTEEEVEEYLRSHAEEIRGKQRVQILSLRFPDPERAASVRDEIVSKRLTFREAVQRTHGGTKEESQIAVPLGGLPEPVRRAVADLPPGQVSEPVRLDGTTFLFVVEESPDREPSGPGALRDLARAELLEERYREASTTLVERLRRDARIVVHEESLPFRYALE
jgi:peptidyl-prolyl cis-trans isomerase SurA